MSLVKFFVKHKLARLKSKIESLNKKDLIMLGLKNVAGITSKKENKLVRKYRKWAHEYECKMKKYFPEDYAKLQTEIKAQEEEIKKKAEEERKKREEEMSKTTTSNLYNYSANNVNKITTLSDANKEHIEDLTKQINNLKRRVSKLEKKVK